MKRKGKLLTKEHVDKHVKKKTMSKVKETQKMPQWIKMNTNKFKWVRWVNLEDLFTLQWIAPWEDLLQEFFTNMGKTRGWKNPRTSVWLKKFDWLSTYSWATWNFPRRCSRCYKCNIWRRKNHFEEDYKSTCFCGKWTMECSSHERRISCEICSHFANNLPTKEVSVF